MFQRVGIITNRGIGEVDSTLSVLLEFLEKKQRQVVLTSCCAQLLQNTALPRVDAADFSASCDLAIAVGGDGTMLRAAHILAGGRDIPLLGINLGRIGFLADIYSHAIASDLDAVLQGEFVEDIRFMLEGSVKRQEQIVHCSHAFNELVLQRWNTARVIKLYAYVDDRFMGMHRSDGMIVSTPTGSTAYALSGGGPVLQPSLNALVLVPICPDTLSNRPTVVHGDSSIEVVVDTDGADQARLIADGELALMLRPGDKVCIRKGRQLRLIHPTHYEPFRILREKLNWSR